MFITLITSLALANPTAAIDFTPPDQAPMFSSVRLLQGTAKSTVDCADATARALADLQQAADKADMTLISVFERGGPDFSSGSEAACVQGKKVVSKLDGLAIDRIENPVSYPSSDLAEVVWDLAQIEREATAQVGMAMMVGSIAKATEGPRGRVNKIEVVQRNGKNYFLMPMLHFTPLPWLTSEHSVATKIWEDVSRGMHNATAADGELPDVDGLAIQVDYEITTSADGSTATTNAMTFYMPITAIEAYLADELGSQGLIDESIVTRGVRDPVRLDNVYIH